MNTTRPSSRITSGAFVGFDGTCGACAGKHHRFGRASLLRRCYRAVLPFGLRCGRMVEVLLILAATLACTERQSVRSTSMGQASTKAPLVSLESRLRNVNAREAEPALSRVRRAQKAGDWYPNEATWLLAEMRRMMRVARESPVLTEKPLAIVVPHAGFRYSGVAAAAAYRNLRRGEYSRVVLIGPSHGHLFDGYALPRYDAYETLLGKIPVCAEADAIRDGKLVVDDARADAREHSLELQLPWLQHTLGNFCLIPILVGITNEASEKALAERLAKLPQEGTLYVASSDFIHYGERFSYTPFGGSAFAAQARVAELDNRAIELLSRLDVSGFRRLIDEASPTICGYRGLLVLGELLRRVAKESQGIPLAHYSSAELTDARDDSGSVDYVSMAYVNQPAKAPLNLPARAPQEASPCPNESPLDDTMGQSLIRVARATLSTALLHDEALSSALSELSASPRLDCRQAVFVTLKKHGHLRGCVGQVTPTYPLFEATVRAALDAAWNDRRFEPVSAAELPALSFELTVLSVPVEIPSYRDIVLGRHGIILSLEGRRSLFLPQVPEEQGFNLEETLRALSEKAGLLPNAWQRPEAKFAVFTGAVFEEHRQEKHEGGRP